MKLTINKTDLISALNYVSKAVSTRTTNPSLEGMYLSCANNILTLFATDLEMSIHTHVDVEMLQSGSAVVPSRIFIEIVRKLPSEQILIETDENKMHLVSDESQIDIHIQSAANYPAIPSVSVTDYMILGSDKLKRAIRETIFAAAIDAQMPVLTGLLLEMSKDQFQLTALDGYRMAIRKETIEDGLEFSCIIPARVLSELYKILNLESNSDVMIKYAEKSVHFTIGDTILISNLIGGNFIKYNDIIPKNSNLIVKTATKKLLDACERASLVAREGKNNLIKFHFEEGQFHIVSNSEVGSANEYVESEIQGSDLKISFNSKYFIDVLKNTSEETVVLYFIDNLSPCVVKTPNSEEMLHVILPVRYKE